MDLTDGELRFEVFRIARDDFFEITEGLLGITGMEECCPVAKIISRRLLMIVARERQCEGGAVGCAQQIEISLKLVLARDRRVDLVRAASFVDEQQHRHGQARAVVEQIAAEQRIPGGDFRRRLVEANDVKRDALRDRNWLGGQANVSGTGVFLGQRDGLEQPGGLEG
jgi:hypothetical protein